MYDGSDEYDGAPPGKVPPPPPYGGPPSYGGYPPYGGYDYYGGQFAAPPAAAPSNSVFQISNNVGGMDDLPPGLCVVCRNGKMEDSASGWTWIMCFLCCFIGLFPGCIAFCCCFRKPKCSKCGYTVG